MSGRLTAAVALVAVLLVTGCNTVITGRGAQAGVPAGGPSAMTSSAPSTSAGPTPSAAEVEPAVFDLGETGTVTDASGTALADVTVSDAALSLTPPDEFSEPPNSGAFLSATVTIENLGEDAFPVAPLDFEVRYPGGESISYGTGSPGVFGFDDPLGVFDLAVGESVTGVVAFDVDPAVTGQQIAYLDLTGRVLGLWIVPEQ